jgi:NADAR domain
MLAKARLYGDAETAGQILAAPHPGAAKALGRQVRGFDEQRWAEHRFDLVVAGNLAKFGQHRQLREFLIGTGSRVLVEASPRDLVWCTQNGPFGMHHERLRNAPCLRAERTAALRLTDVSSSSVLRAAGPRRAWLGGIVRQATRSRPVRP